LTLKEMRKARGLRQIDVAISLNVDKSAVCHWESGKFRPARKHHKPLARLYGCTVDELCEQLPAKSAGKEGGP